MKNSERAETLITTDFKQKQLFPLLKHRRFFLYIFVAISHINEIFKLNYYTFSDCTVHSIQADLHTHFEIH